MTADECQRRAEEAKALAAQTRDLWEREAFLRVATQWHLIAAHKEDQQAQRIIKEGGGIYPSVPLSAAVLLCFRQKVLFVSVLVLYCNFGERIGGGLILRVQHLHNAGAENKAANDPVVQSCPRGCWAVSDGK